MIRVPPILSALAFAAAGGKEKHWIGWQEWASLPDLGYERLRVKIDTGAQTSSLHVWRVRPEGMTEDENGEPTPLLRLQLDSDGAGGGAKRDILTPLVRHVMVVGSSGRRQRRPVIRTRLILGPVEKVIEVNVTNREAMQFRMIIGRTALGTDFIVDVNREFLLGLPRRAQR